jgi:hypothetical protein
VPSLSKTRKLQVGMEHPDGCIPTSRPSSPHFEANPSIQARSSIVETDTFQQVRATILEEFDDDMMPGPDFCFHVNGCCLSRKQESCRLAWSILTGTSQQVVRLHHILKPTRRSKLAPTVLSSSRAG